MRARWLAAAFLLVVLTVVSVVASAAARKPAKRVSPAPQVKPAATARPKEKVAPPPQVNPNAVVWRTPEPPKGAQAGDVWVNPKDGMEMVYVPAGEFVLGMSDAQVEAWLKEYPRDKRDDFKDEQPQCRVNLPGYWIGRTEVTNAQYLRFVRATGHRAPYHWKVGEVPSGLESFPVVYVSWEDARAYAEWAGGRLPSELEWEKATRGADGRVFPWGNEWDSKRCRNLELITGMKYTTVDEWLSAADRWVSAHDPVREAPAAVGAYAAGASPYGCLDMTANVWEWCADWYEGKAYHRYAKGDLKAPARESELNPRKVFRGGSWGEGLPPRFRCAYRRSNFPVTLALDVGFRCARGLL